MRIQWQYPHRVRKVAEAPIANALVRADLRWLLSRVPSTK